MGDVHPADYPEHRDGRPRQFTASSRSIDPRWPRLLAAGRAWRASMIPRTSTGTAGPTNSLLEALAAFDNDAEGTIP